MNRVELFPAVRNMLPLRKQDFPVFFWIPQLCWDPVLDTSREKGLFILAASTYLLRAVGNPFHCLCICLLASLMDRICIYVFVA